MTEPTDKTQARRGITLKRFCFLVALALFLFISLVLLPRFVWEMGIHAVAGWAFFLQRNLSEFSFDRGIFFSGCIAAGIALFVLHTLARGSARRSWNWSQSTTLLMLLPLGFAASFLVPGVILMLRTPMPDALVERSRASEKAVQTMHLRNFAQALHYHCLEQQLESYPADPDPVLQELQMLDGPPFQHGYAASGFLYFAGGAPLEAKERRIFAASSTFEQDGETVRVIVFTDWKFETLNRQELERLLDQQANTAS